MKKTYEKLLSDIAGLKIIDAHDHLLSEHDRISAKVDVFTLFSQFTCCDLGSAGMGPEDKEKLQDRSISLDERWYIFEPFWNKIRHTSYARAVLLTLRDIYGYSDLKADNYQQITDSIQRANKPGLYKKILRDKCNIEVVLNQGYVAPKDDAVFKTVSHVGRNPLWEAVNLEGIEKAQQQLNLPLKTADDIRESVRKQAEHFVRDYGVVGFKTPGLDFRCPSNDEVNAALKKIRDKGIVSEQQRHMLNSLIVHTTIDKSIELDVPIAVHLGLTWDNWINFYPLKPSNIVPWLHKYRDAKFDLYHMGIPWHDEMMIIGKIYPNVWLNFCWCHIVSQQLSVELLSKSLDLVATNKIIGFGGDYKDSVEIVYGHLAMAREDIAQVLAIRVGNDLMTYGQALEIARNWLYSNPKELYKL